MAKCGRRSESCPPNGARVSVRGDILPIPSFHTHAPFNTCRSEEGNEPSVVHRLVQMTHQQHADMRSLELQLNHSNLQVQALVAREADLCEQVDVLQYTIASVEQDKLLLETKLQDIAGFEGSRAANCSISLKDIRGRLLGVANAKITELSRALQKCQQSAESEKASPRAEMSRMSHENEALREEVVRISEQLAQRTVLYAAQERRYHDATRTNGSLRNEKDTENVQLRARLQQLEQQYERSDRAHIEAVLQTRQLEETSRRLQGQLSDAVEKSRALETDVTDLSSQNMSLQATVERLRGADMDELERELAAEVEMIRAESKVREDALRRHLESARENMSAEIERRERLVDEVERLRGELSQQGSVLREAADRGLIHSMHGFDATPSSELRLDAFATDLEVTHISGRRRGVDASGDNSVFAAMFGTLDEAGVVSEWAEHSSIDDGASEMKSGKSNRYGDHDDESDTKAEGRVGGAAPTDEFLLPLIAASALRAIKSLVHQLIGPADSNGADESTASELEKKLLAVLLQLSTAGAAEKPSLELWVDAKALTIEAIQGPNKLDGRVSSHSREELWHGVTSLLLQTTSLVSAKTVVLGTGLRPAGKDDAMTNNGSLSKQFLTGAHSEDGGTAESSFVSSNSTQNVPTTAEGLLREELAALKEELIRRKRREQKLLAAYKEQGGKLAMVIKKASELNAPVSSSRDEAARQQKESDENLRLQAEIAVLRQQLDGFREELACAERQTESSRQLGYHEAAEMHSCSIRLLEHEVKELKATLVEATAVATRAEVSHAGCQADFEAAVAVEHKEAEVQADAPEGGDASLSEVAGMREQIRVLKQALIDSCHELETIQCTIFKSRNQPRRATATAQKSVSMSDEDSGSFASALSHAEENEERRSMEEALVSHIRLWDERAETWTSEQSVILQKLGEAQNSLAALSAKHDDDKREALAALRLALVSSHDKEMANLRIHHRDEVNDLICRLQSEHSEAVDSATKAMQLQLHQLIASLMQDHQLEMQQLEGRYAGRALQCMTAEASTHTDGLVEEAGGHEIFRAKLLELKRQYEQEMSTALHLLKCELEQVHEARMFETSMAAQAQHDRERKRLVDRYRGKLQRQEAAFREEREELLSHVKREFTEIAHETFKVAEDEVRNSLPSFEGETSTSSWLSPAVTCNLIQGINGRSLSLAASSDFFEDSSFSQPRRPVKRGKKSK